MEVSTDEKKIDELLSRGVIVSVLPTKDAFREKLLSGERLRIYIGADPTSTALHLSHAKNYMTLEDFRRLGHEVIVLFGDFTAQIGDPTERASTRKQLTSKDVQINMETWKHQLEPILNFSDPKNPALVKFNSDWLSKLSFADVVSLASNFTVQQMLERDMFERRIKAGEMVHLHEFLYPLMQGYDSVAMEVDAEMGGTDQTFNMLAGRTLLKRLKQKDKFVIVVNLLENPMTGELMSKSRGTGVFLNATGAEMYGQIMAQPDEMIKPLFINCTRLPIEEIETIISGHPKEAKMRLAREIVGMYHNEKAAQKAEESFVSTFSEGGVPSDISETRIESGIAYLDALSGWFATPINTAISKSELRRLAEAGAISEVGGEVLKDINAPVERNVTLRIGKRRFLKITIV
jgi:tyrosyl-tRNA synthetase